ncbi:S-layer homology domain-containing protein [Domibacillus aminovorans]|uniref:SLH domain-containing protein n=1 Tax=Domibacillus aminovorans TaxID=29332 RepID=A0A177L1B9_9BACI|nr:S-layer homology domain-containing protein [Domibacillus aminovorans]OAH59065.1 hypothetical protein AWH49_05235 [Domibacillus aminovorans]
MRKIGGSLVVFLLVFTFTLQVSAQTFSDVSNHWAKSEIESLTDEGVILGYEDGTFRPYEQVTRGQFLAYLVRALDLPAGTSAFPDVPTSSRLYHDIAAAKKAGLILGNANGLAKANEPVTRSDVAAMLDRAMQLKGDYMKRAPLTFTDAAKIGLYAYGAVERMTFYGLIRGTADNKFEPAKIATRGESAVFVHRLMSILDLLGNPKDPVEIPKPVDNQEVVIPVTNSQYVKVRMNTRGVPLTYNKQTTDSHILSTDTHYYYHMGNASKPLGSLQVTLRKLDNGDTFIFTKFLHNGNNTYSASVIMPFSQSDNYSLAKYASHGTVDQSHDSTFGVDKTSHPTGILSVKNGSTVTNEVMMGKNYISVQRQTNYANGQRSIIRELSSERESYNLYTDKARKLVTAHQNVSVQSKAISETWALVSEKPLFASTTNRNDWFKRTILEYSQINNWLTADGAYTKLPWSIEPGYKMGYGRNIGRLQGGIYLTAYNGNKERYFRDLVVNAVADLDVFSDGAITAGKSPIFKTEYTSTWLKNTYGTTAPYIDTRHNENAALFLKNTAEALAVPKLADANLRYADFLVSQKSLGNTIAVTPTSYLISDYYAIGSKKTHVSLNHALGEMRFLLETYKQTGNADYLKTARELKAGIENLHPKWIRSNGDLWYQINGSLVFSGNDYDWLTLMDLLLSQNAFAENGIERSTIFDAMIRSKTKYLVDHNIAIKGQIILLLQEQGFGDLVKSSASAADYSSSKLDDDNLPKDTLDLLAE